MSLSFVNSWKWRSFVWNIKSICRIPKSTYMCIKYPFLYPRNVWTGKHYNNWKIYHYLYDDDINSNKQPLYKRAFEFVKDSSEDNRFKTKKIIKSLPLAIWFYIVKFYSDYILAFFHCLPTYTWWDSCPKGWNKAFGKQYLDELKVQLKKENFLYKFRITTVKEKWNTLRVYCECASDEVYKIINKYELLSREYCIECGKPATKITGGYVCSYCNDCCPKNSNLYKIKVNGKWEYSPDYNEF